MPPTGKSATPVSFWAPKIEIIAAPRGEAPLWVRQAWVGLLLPLAIDGPVQAETFGVLSGPRGWLKALFLRWMGRAPVQEGYVVIALVAIEILEGHNPEAAQWWRDHTPHLLDGEQPFLFEASACRRPQTSWPKPAND